jgi:trans-aconitate methyltransferase
MTTRDRFPEIYGNIVPAWDIGRPQPDLMTAFDELALTGSVIDLGCGPGDWTVRLADFAGSAIGVDISESLLDTARRSVATAQAPERIRFIRTGIRQSVSYAISMGH